MKTGNWMHRLGPGLLALVLLLSCCAAAGADEDRTDQSEAMMMVLAQDAVSAFGLRDAAGQPLVPRIAPDTEGRGFPAEDGGEPDYRGVVGYISLQVSWDVTRFNTFTQTPWMLPVYERVGDGWQAAGAIQHKTPVLVFDQQLSEDSGRYAGYLQAVRLDTREIAWIDVAQFVTVPYWTLEISEAVRHGYCVAVYREKSRYDPMDKKGRSGPLPEGIRVLMCDMRTADTHFVNPDTDHHPLLGILFRSKLESRSYLRTFLFFHPDDLTLVY